MSYPNGLPPPPPTHPASPPRGTAARAGYSAQPPPPQQHYTASTLCGPTQAELELSKAQAAADSPQRLRGAAYQTPPVHLPPSQPVYQPRPTQAELDLSRAQAEADSPPRVRGGPQHPHPGPRPTQEELERSRAQAEADSPPRVRGGPQHPMYLGTASAVGGGAPAPPPARPKLHGLPFSPNQMPVAGLLAELGVDYEDVVCDITKGESKTPEFLAKNPMHCIPSFEDGDLFIWESASILRYISNKWAPGSHWYPSDLKARALCDMMLDHRQTSIYPILGPVLLYPKVGFGPPKSAEEEAAALEKFTNDVWPAVQHVIRLNGGSFLGGARPNIADVANLGILQALSWAVPDCPALAVEGVKAYMDALAAAMPKYQQANAGAAQVWPALAK
eukprot:TRINITY_DN1716_c0_g1_i1.p2 TRINITY_DN1716_c0_g1~~TRINITY_DN1716_c0_g1_i1.p2  ORF type:complete len:419 (+),score=75.44 TRINITY_DN1716_c0_g1_i1:90-1259(+)